MRGSTLLRGVFTIGLMSSSAMAGTAFNNLNGAQILTAPPLAPAFSGAWTGVAFIVLCNAGVLANRRSRAAQE